MEILSSIALIIVVVSTAYLGYIVGYELGWYDKEKNKKHRFRK